MARLIRLLPAFWSEAGKQQKTWGKKSRQPEAHLI